MHILVPCGRQETHTETTNFGPHSSLGIKRHRYSKRVIIISRSIKYQFMATPARATAPVTFNAQASNSFSKAKANAKTPREGRRGLLIVSTATAITLVSDSKTDFNKYLKKSQENKAKNDKERLDSFYKRNYKDYFGLLEGDLRQKKDLSESEKAILDWLDSNK